VKPPTVIRCIAFHKGDQLEDWLLEYLINAASRGKITEAGKRLLLIPVDGYEKARRKQQAISVLPKNDQELELRLSQISEFGPLFSVYSGTKNVTPVDGIRFDANRNAKCPICSASLAGRRRGTKYCSDACKQIAYRDRETV
jgi:hypothetical protein